MKKVDYEHFGRFLAPYNLMCRDGALYYAVKRTDFADNGYKSDLFVLRDGVQKQLTASGDVSAYALEEDGIYFTSLRDAKDKEAAKAGKPLTVFYRLDYDGGEAQEVCRLDMLVTSFLLQRPGRFFFVAAYSHELAAAMVEAKGDMDAVLKIMTENADYQVADELPYWFNGMGYTNKVRPRLYLYDNGGIQPLTDEYTMVEGIWLAPNHKRLVYLAKRYTDVATATDNLYCVDTETLAQKDVSIGEDYMYSYVGFLHDDQLIVGATQGKEYGLNQNPDIYNCDLSTGTSIKLNHAELPSMMGNSVNCDIKAGRSMPTPPLVVGKDYFYIDTVEDSAQLMRLDTESGDFAPVTTQRGMVQEAILCEDGSFAMIAARGNGGCEIYQVKMDGAEIRLSALNTAVCEEYAYSPVQDIRFDNENGVSIQGFVIPPTDHKKGEKYPTILVIHGGPKTVYGNSYIHEMQLWAGMGYAVIFCNPTGGDGRGNEFSDIRGKYGTVDFCDLMTFCDKCIEQFDFIDADRMGVTGGSYGGFMTNWVIGHTNRFKAAASQRSISNWLSFSMMADIGPHFGSDQNAGLMWQDLDKVWTQSPLKYADKVETPTLFIHSDEDYRCPLAEGMQMFSALKHFGVPARLVIFKGENHELSRRGKPKHRVRRLKEITEWFEQYLKV